MNHDLSGGTVEKRADSNMNITSAENASSRLHYNPNSNSQAATQYPGVKLREKRQQTNQEKSETQRKRNSKNRLSNRRSTGFVTPEEIEAALSLQATENV